MTITLRSFLPRFILCSLFMALSGTAAFAGPIKTYQVTGPVLEVTDTTITIEKEKEKWQIARDKETKVTGDLKPGAKVTIQYRMSATAVEVKGDAKGDSKSDTKAAKEEAKDDGKPAKDRAAAKK